MTFAFEQGNFHNHSLDFQADGDLLQRLESLLQHLGETYEAITQSLILALELHDGESRAHAFRVTELALALAKELHVPEDQLTYIRYGALLHDVGKIGVPGHILKKKEALNQEDWEMIKKHPAFAYELLSSIEFLKPALEIPYSHHERWDGAGYPHGLKGEQIPLSARIFSVVDVWDALRSKRPYRVQSWTDEQIIAYIHENSGHQFDPHIANTFTDLITKIQLPS